MRYVYEAVKFWADDTLSATFFKALNTNHVHAALWYFGGIKSINSTQEEVVSDLVLHQS